MKAFRSDIGFSIVEVVIASAILFIVATGAMVGLASASNVSVGNNMRELALALANDRMEQARNLEYDKIGTMNGYPTGDIPNQETVDDFVVHTTIGWSEDPNTGLSTSKNILIAVTWTEPGSGGRVAIESNIAGKSKIANAGDVKINVVDVDTGEPIAGATVSIKPLTGPTASGTTNSDGYARWGKIPAGKIVINASRQGYALDLTPLTNASVVADQLNEWTIQGARPSFGTVRIRDQFSNPVVGANVTIAGPTGTHVKATDDAGNAAFDGLLKGTYSVASAGPTGYGNGSGSLGIITSGGTFTSNVGVTKQGRAIVTVKDTQGAVVQGATVNLTGSGTITPASASTGADGKTTHLLSGSGNFTATVSKSGYLGNTGSATIASGGDGAITVTIEKMSGIINVTVKNSANGTVVSGVAVSVTGPGSVSPASGTTNASGLFTCTVGLPGVYTINGSKSLFVNGSTTTSVANGGTQNVTLNLDPITTGVLSAKYTSNVTGSKTVYIFNSTFTRLTDTLTFTGKNTTKTITLPFGQYYVSTQTTYNSSKAVPALVPAGGTVNVSLSSSN